MHPARVAQNGSGEALGLSPRARFGRERFGIPRDRGERRLELVGHVGDEVAPHSFQASQLGHVADHEEPAPVRQPAAGDEQRAPAALELMRLRLVPGEHGRNQVARRLLVEELGQRWKRIVGPVPQEAPGRPVEGDDRTAGVRRHHAVRHGLDQRPGLLALAHQVGEALVELLVHGTERDDVLGNLGDGRVGERRRPAVGDRAGSAAELHERLGDLAGEQPGQRAGAEERGQPHERHGALHRVHLRIHGGEGGGDPDHGEPGGAAAHGDIHSPLVGGRAETLRAADARGQRLLDLGTQQVVLEPIQRRAVELGVSADSALGVDERHASTDAGAELASELGPPQRVRRQEVGHQAGFALEAPGHLVLQMAAQQPVRADGEPADGGGYEQARRDEQPRGELHERLWPRSSGGGRRNR